MTAQKRTEAIKNLITLYERDLGSILEVGSKFDISKLPAPIQDIIKVVTAKAPSFSNIAALGVANYGMSHVLGQLRPRINSPVYSSNMIGVNAYSIIISNSGTGKSSSASAVLSAFEPALQLIEGQRKQKQIELAKEIALQNARQDDPKLTLNDITEAMAQPFIKPLPRITASSSSTRGGLASLLNKLQHEQYGNLSVVIDELGLALKSGNTIDEVLAFLTECFDMGRSEAPEFKSEEVKESSIEGMYTNLLAHTSPKIVFGYESVRDKLSMLFHTALARRCNFSFPDEDESCENNPVPDTIAAARQLNHIRHDIMANTAPLISDRMTDIVRQMVTNPMMRIVTFDHDASTLYADYFDYCIKRSEIMEDSSISQIEMAGRSFRLGKLAALWALTCGSNIITKEIYQAVIYYAEYNSKYLEKFVKLTNAQPFELLAQVFKSGKTNIITLDSALTNGYINRVSKDFKEILDPLNSVLRTDGTVSYNEESKVFIYSAYKRIQEEESQGDLCMSYTILPDGTSKDDRQYHLNAFDKARCNLGLQNIVNLLSKDAIYSAFTYDTITDDEGNQVENKRGQATINSDTKLIVIDVDKSEVPMEVISEYLESFKHIVATTSDPTNKLKFRIILPINVELSGKDTKQYAYVVKRICADLLVQADKVSFNPAQPFYAYSNSEILFNESGQLLDITGYLTDYANDPEFHNQKPLPSVKPKTEAARKSHVNRIMDNVNTKFSFAIEAQHGEGSLMLARACLFMRDEHFTAEEMTAVINYINSCWESPMPQTRIDKLLLQYLNQCVS